MAYTTVERSALYTLLFLRRPVANKDLKETHRVDLKPASRKKLIQEGLIAEQKRGRSFDLELTRKGRDWASLDMAAEPPKRLSPFNPAVVYGLLNAIASGLAHRSLSLDDLIEGAAPPRPAVKTASIPDQIKAAYRRLAKRPREWVFLSELRPMITGASRAEVDSALKSLYSDKEIHFTSEADQKSLTSDQRSSAIRLGVADMHLISME